jgi:protein-S-isoprenylcysteine O-methyltransferase Ste14
MDETAGLVMSGKTSVYFTVLGTWALVACAIAVYLFVRPAPYGRHHRPGFGPAIGARVAWLIMEAPSPLGMALLFWAGNRSGNRVAQIALGLWLLHYGYRAFIYPWLLPASSRPMPILVVASGAFFNLVNAYLNGRWLFGLGPVLPVDWLISPAFLVGTGMFGVGIAIHVLADRELRRVRKASAGQRGVPTGPLFSLVSCPNYAGEIVEWAGFALATWSPGGLIFLLWTLANLVPRAFHHHRWYRATFPDYPPKRHAVIPRLL